MTLAAFGITGDLMRLKILPALYGLHSRGELPNDIHIVGVSRKSWSDIQLRSYIKEILPQSEESFLSVFSFLQGDAEDQATFSALLKECGDDDVLAYFALSPSLYKNAFENMQHAGFGLRAGTTRVMIEKPFGTSGDSAEELYELLKGVVPQDNIFFVDHYLAKDWVRGLSALSVRREDISNIHIRFFETIGVEKRGISYDQLGALCDVGQNHVLQIVAHILAPQAPASPEARAEALEHLPTLSSEEVATETVRAQYEGYKDIKGVAADSQTETYFKIHTPLLTLEGGKALPQSSKEIILSLKDGSEIVVPESPNKIPEYEMLLSAAMNGDQTLFPSIREIHAQWRFVDPIVKVWTEGSPKLIFYKAGTIQERTLL